MKSIKVKVFAALLLLAVAVSSVSGATAPTLAVCNNGLVATYGEDGGIPSIQLNTVTSGRTAIHTVVVLGSQPQLKDAGESLSPNNPLSCGPENIFFQTQEGNLWGVPRNGGTPFSVTNLLDLELGIAGDISYPTIGPDGNLYFAVRVGRETAIVRFEGEQHVALLQTFHTSPAMVNGFATIDGVLKVSVKLGGTTTFRTAVPPPNPDLQ
jgi:hypothetical protein